jgi:hypothetical protein
MLIRVLCRDKSRGYVENYYLDGMIRRGIVVAFYRPQSNRWVDVKYDRIRKKVSLEYKGVERRSKTRTSGKDGK